MKDCDFNFFQQNEGVHMMLCMSFSSKKSVYCRWLKEQKHFKYEWDKKLLILGKSGIFNSDELSFQIWKIFNMVVSTKWYSSVELEIPLFLHIQKFFTPFVFEKFFTPLTDHRWHTHTHTFFYEENSYTTSQSSHHLLFKNPKPKS